MRRFIATAILFGLVTGCQETSVPLSDEPAYVPSTPSRFDAASTGSISGRVHWNGAIPTVPDIAVERLMADGIKVEHVQRPNPHAPKIDGTGGVGGAVVFLRGIDSTQSRPWDYPPVTVDMRDDGPIVRQGTTEPGLIGFAHRGADLTMISRQARYQMVRARGAAFFTLAMPDADQPRTRPLIETGRVEITSAAGDTALRGHIFVDDHPYYTLTENNGGYSLSRVPPGTYQLVCWRPNWRIERQERDPESLLRVRLLFQAALETSIPVVVRSGEETKVLIEVSAD